MVNSIPYWNSIQIENKIGEGSFSIIYKIRNKQTGKIFALKEIKLENMHSLQYVLNELLPFNLIHCNLIKYTLLFVDIRPSEIEDIDIKMSQIDLSENFKYNSIHKSDYENCTNYIHEKCIKCNKIDLNNIHNQHYKLKIRSHLHNLINNGNRDVYCYLQCNYYELSLYQFIKMRNDYIERHNDFQVLLSQSVDIINNKTVVNRLFCAVLLKNIIRGILYLHSFNILHGDLKSNNILLKVENNFIIPKIIDYGLKKTNQTNFRKDHKGLGVIYFELLTQTSTLMECIELKLDLKKNNKLPHKFNTFYKTEGNIIVECMNNNMKTVSDTRKLFEEIVNYIQELRNTK